MRNSQQISAATVSLLGIVVMHITWGYSDAIPVTTNKAIHKDIDLEIEMTNRTTRAGKPIAHELSIATWNVGSSIDSMKCLNPENPIVWFLGGTWIFYEGWVEINRTCEGGFHYNGCPYTLWIAHECSGAHGSCSFIPAKPDEESRCPTTHYSLRYQCLPVPTAENPLKPYAMTPENADPNDPCLPLYVGKQAGVGG
ncbi:uncharacterized protein LOC129592315 [Paramacrobiotus metropolitanus]|uniref:uncharacterized protein LOC129592315 n=1 Tax=Paramacrobiotus metropolitanus TaxID=2943436 RepID=UPI002445DE6D|nr:uncharacterized protein LOC129592315 [Paramacrobiotus metropolitanus]